MICHRCGTVDSLVAIPEITRYSHILGECKLCQASIVAAPTMRKSEMSQQATVTQGEYREEILASQYVQMIGSSIAEKLPPYSDIDRKAVDADGKVRAYFEIKERSNTLNAYRVTKFPYAKIEAAARLHAQTSLEVHFVLVFSDCWARHTFQPHAAYEKGALPFAPSYRPGQRTSMRQIPVLIPVDTFEVLKHE